MPARFETDTEKYTTVYSQNEDPGVYLVRVPENPSDDVSYPLEPGEAGVLFTGHSELGIEALNGTGIFFSVDKISTVVEKGAQGSSFEPISGFQTYDDERSCIWCNDNIEASDSAIEFQTEAIQTIFSDYPPTFHSSCFLTFRKSLAEILQQPEIVSHSV